MVKPISQTLLDNLTKDSRKIDLTQTIDWLGDNSFSFNIKDDILSSSIDIKSEGELNNVILDKATTTVNNTNGNYSPKNMLGDWSGNVVPYRKTKIYVGDGNENIEVFSGMIEGINPNFNTNKVSLSTGDMLSILKREKCPDKFYVDTYKEVIIKEWLNELNMSYTVDTIDDTHEKISYSFSGMTYFEGLKLIAESVWGSFYFADGVFYFRVKKEYEQPDEITHNFYTYGENDNVIKISEKYDNNQLYNEVEVISNPLTIQSETPVWTGFSTKVENEVVKTYADIDINNVLNLEETEHLPINENSLSVEDDMGHIYTIGNGGITEIDYSNGLITFAEGHSEKIGFLYVRYSYNPVIVLPNSTKTFTVEFENPVAELFAPTYNAKISDAEYESDMRRDEITEARTNTGSDYTFNTTMSPNLLYQVRVNLRVQADMDDWHGWHSWEYNHYYSKEAKVNLYYRKIGDSNWTLLKRFQKKQELENKSFSTDYYDWTYVKELPVYENGYEFKVEMVSSRYPILSASCTSISKTYDHNVQEIDNASIEYSYNLHENRKQVTLILTNNTVHSALFYGVHEGKNTNLYFMGKPFIHMKNYKIVKTNQDSINAFGVKSRLTIKNDLICDGDIDSKDQDNQTKIDFLSEYLIDKYSTPHSYLSVESVGLPHLELNDKVYVYQKERNIDNEFLIKGIKHKFNNGEWTTTYELMQDKMSSWTYTGGSGSIDNDIKPKPIDNNPPVVPYIDTTLLQASYEGNNRVKIQWGAVNEPDIHGYRIYRKEDNENFWSAISTVDKSTIQYIDSSVLYDKTYNYQIRAYDLQDNESDINNSPISMITIKQTANPYVPSFIIDNCIFDDELVLEWEDLDNIKAYELRLDQNWGEETSNLLYKGVNNTFRIKSPTTRLYNFHLKSIDKSELYSIEHSSITMRNSYPKTPKPPIVTSFFGKLWIDVQDETVDNLSLGDDIKGYKLHVTPSDGSGNATDDTEIIDLATPSKITYSANVGQFFLIEVSAYDILGEGGKSSPIEVATSKINSLTDFADSIRPIEIVDALPVLPDSKYPKGVMVYLTTEDKIYTSDGSQWNSIQTEIGAGEITETHIANGAITTDKILANAVTAGKIQAGAIGADEISANAITSTHVGANEIITDMANINQAVVDNLQAIEITAEMITVGSGTSFESDDYDPTKKATQEDIESYAEAKIPKGTTAPSSPVDGELWIDTTPDPNVLKRYESTTTSWIKVTPTTANDVGAEQNIMRGITAPNNPSNGDLWIDTSVIPNILKVYDGSSWINSRITDTSQVNDGAGLGSTAEWSQVIDDNSGKPVDNATPNDMDTYVGTAGSGTITLDNTGIRHSSGNFEINSDGTAKFKGSIEVGSTVGSNNIDDLETKAGATSKANSAENSAKAYANEVIKDKMRLKPPNAHLWHFDKHLTSTDGITAELV